ncbi:hypothetical protein DESA109040_08275 [Deinococcus saxicola]
MPLLVATLAHEVNPQTQVTGIMGPRLNCQDVNANIGRRIGDFSEITAD